MSRAVLGVRARRGLLLTLAAMATVVTAGAVTVLGFGDLAGTSPWLVLPLLVIGVVAALAAGHELATARREEIGLARLRGVHGLALSAFLLFEPFLAIVAGVVAGTALGALGTWLTSWWWLPEAGVAFTTATAAVAGGVVVVGLLAVAVGLAGAGRQPLSDQVAISPRPHPAGTASIFLSVLVMVAAAIAIYRSGRGTDPDWVVLAGPALVGLAAGQLTVWLLRGLARIATARTNGSRMPAFLATRRVGRSADVGGALRLLVAAGAVATLAATAAAGVAAWSGESARFATGAPLRISFDTGAQAALALTDQYDPEGRWLMGAVLVADDSAQRRRAFVDTRRFDAVVGDFYDGTGAAGVGADLGALAAERPTQAVGDEFSVTVQRLDPRVDNTPPQATGAVQVTVEYVTADGSSGTVTNRLVAEDGGAVTATEPLDDCARGCVARRLLVETGVEFEGDFFVIGGGNPGQPRRVDGRRVTTFTELGFGDQDLVDETWVVSGADERPPRETGTVEVTDPGLAVTTGFDGNFRADAASTLQTVPVLATTGLGFGDGGPQIDSPGGDELGADVQTELPALPLVGGAGMLADLRTALYASSPTVPAAQVMVLAAADTPADVLAALVDEGGTVSTFDEVRATGARETGAVSASVYAVMAGCCLVVALLALLAASTRQRESYRRDVAALRVVGVPTAQIRSAGRGELMMLTVVTVVAGVGAGLVAASLLLGDLPLVTVPEFSVPLESVSSLLPALVIGLVLAAMVALVTARTRRVEPDRTRPALLREETWVEAGR